MPIPKRQVVFSHRPGSRRFGTREEFWIEAPIDPEWTVAYRVLPQGGRPVIAEVRIFPSVPELGAWRPHAGHWEPVQLERMREDLKVEAKVPEGGVTARLLRDVRLGSDFAEGLKAGNRYLHLVPAARPRVRRAGFRRLKRTREGHGWPDDTLLQAAAFYVERGGRRPVADLAKAWSLKPSQARDMLQAAGAKGYLTPGTQGKTSRALTEKAKALLNKESRS
jgi:hypothetical protein